MEVNSTQTTTVSQTPVAAAQTKQPSAFCRYFGNCAENFGWWLRKHGKKIVTALVVMFLIYLLIVFLAIEIEENQIMEETAAAAYLTAMYHWRCKGKGCSGKCPYSDKADPRVFVSEQSEYITELLNHMRAHLNNEISTNNVDIVENKTLVTELSECVSEEARAVDNVFKIRLAASAIDSNYSNCTVNAGTYKAQNHLAALSNMADVNKAALIINSLARLNVIYSKLLEKENTSGSKSKVRNFDKHYTDWYNAVTAIKSNKNTCDAIVKPSADFDQTQALILNSVENKLSLSDASTNGLMDQVIKLASYKDQINKIVEDTIKQFNAINDFKDAYDNAYNKFEGFNNDMPGKISNDSMNDLISQGNYNEAIIRSALEPDVVAKHKLFAADRNTFDNSVNQYSIRDDPNDVVPWVAYSRPSYTKSDGITSADVGNTALTSIPSDNINAMQAKPAKFSFSG